ncbi:RNA-directed RNA polymerase [Reticulomyxa filosa]|uniref:RNA-dependent RNA polymerase n=1 Tax=Reticulomyxa filosa TaxID=46433 RepID=X6N398_RETFI|nr:RNA-directed RNA polymerase [Reticulomyxa filosa]|eukprot:ETO20353.1 RNA-directed RNA polymerase [Reticulomyxa filosa]
MYIFRDIFSFFFFFFFKKKKKANVGCFANKEWISNAYWHYFSMQKENEFEKSMKRYLHEYITKINKAYKSRLDAIEFVECAMVAENVSAFETLTENVPKKYRQNLHRSMGAEMMREDNIGMPPDYYYSYSPSMLTLICNERPKIISLMKEAWAQMISKLRIHLPWPSGRIVGNADWTRTLRENEVFYKVKIPFSVVITKYINKMYTYLFIYLFYLFVCLKPIECPFCQQVMEKFQKKCKECKAHRQLYRVFQGDVGILKNPCLHPRGYRRFIAVCNDELDRMFDGECLLFSTHPTCKTSPVFECSGGDLDGDDFLVITF